MASAPWDRALSFSDMTFSGVIPPDETKPGAEFGVIDPDKSTEAASPVVVSRNPADWKDIRSRTPANTYALFILLECARMVLTITDRHSAWVCRHLRRRSYMKSATER
jgi:hypothetical protein